MTSSWQGNRPMTAFGLAVVVALVVYGVFMALNDFWLPERTGPARVVQKGVLQGGKTYSTRVIDGRPLVTGTATPEAYLLDLDLEGQDVQAVVPRATYDAVEPGARVEAAYVRRRLTGGIVVREVQTGRSENR
jgi:hypothetical protein